MYKGRLTAFGQLWRHGQLLMAVLFALGPILWVISASFNPSNTIVGQSLIPANPTLAHYRQLFQDPRHPFHLWIWNSTKVAVIASTLTVALTALGAYAFSRFRFRGRRGGLFTLILIQMFPQMLAMVAIYLLLLQLGEVFPALGLNTHAGLIMVYLGGALGVNTWLMKGYFDTIPRSLEESAMMDGATPFQAFVRIIMPLVRPILIVVFMLSLIGCYSEYVLARIILQTTDQYTLPVGMQLFISDQYSSRWGIFAAGALLGALPIVIIFLVMQRQLVSGLTSGAVKE
ncbi:MAG: maltose ABC transporter permease MalG [Firmicutes bacterium]|nr:maltose ABC transporter permease MalG [Bacillota bacterium]